jgi:hypothetical protein
MMPNVKIKVMDERGRTAHLSPAQLQVIGPTLNDMMAGKISVKLANDVIIQKLADAGQPVEFEEQG